ncbi:hypothetical protein EJ08DRAFT_695865 [Tothia fuscella]|uniref:Uncharacterized protein n=1 Tax=Tothia fuscella TaxID=1048955 RepID=A0A9P4U042_9PEZI|nr:hypothetical protein EJ08DRAFT_695865 [Tothia fuscella]
MSVRNMPLKRKRTTSSSLFDNDEPTDPPSKRARVSPQPEPKSVTPVDQRQQQDDDQENSAGEEVPSAPNTASDSSSVSLVTDGRRPSFLAPINASAEYMIRREYIGLQNAKEVKDARKGHQSKGKDPHKVWEFISMSEDGCTLTFKHKTLAAVIQQVEFNPPDWNDQKEAKKWKDQRGNFRYYEAGKVSTKSTTAGEEEKEAENRPSFTAKKNATTAQSEKEGKEDNDPKENIFAPYSDEEIFAAAGDESELSDEDEDEDVDRERG